MALSSGLKTKVAHFVDTYMKRYLHMRSEGIKPDDTIKRMYLSYRDDVDRKWEALSLSEQITQWTNLTFTDQIVIFDPSDAEEKIIFEGLINSMLLVCPEREDVHKQCAEYAQLYLVKKYNIGASIKL